MYLYAEMCIGNSLGDIDFLGQSQVHSPEEEVIRLRQAWQNGPLTTSGTERNAIRSIAHFFQGQFKVAMTAYFAALLPRDHNDEGLQNLLDEMYQHATGNDISRGNIELY